MTCNSDTTADIFNDRDLILTAISELQGTIGKIQQDIGTDKGSLEQSITIIEKTGKILVVFFFLVVVIIFILLLILFFRRIYIKWEPATTYVATPQPFNYPTYQPPPPLTSAQIEDEILMG